MLDRDELFMLAGPVLSGYLTDPATIEIIVNPNGSCFVEQFGHSMQERAPMEPRDLDRFLRAIAHAVGQEWRATSPRLHAALSEVGWRVQAAMPPQAPGLTMALRVHPNKVYPLDDYLAKGILTDAQVAILREAIRARKRIILSGATGSAKTSLLNALLHELINSTVRFVILQDDPEIICQARDTTWLQTVNGVTLADLVVESLRYRPDILVVGEVRTGMAKVMCEAFETGHGGLCTVHAKSAEATLTRFEVLIQREGPSAERELIGEAIDIIAHLERTEEGIRHCTGIVAVQDYHNGDYRIEHLA